MVYAMDVVVYVCTLDFPIGSVLPFHVQPLRQPHKVA
jgi:hypothetical protein